jgi:hypothetical protein
VVGFAVCKVTIMQLGEFCHASPLLRDVDCAADDDPLASILLGFMMIELMMIAAKIDTTSTSATP